MEGIAAEAASLAGHQKLSNLCWLYDSNNITIEGDTAIAFTEDVATRFEGYGWAVQHVDDANDIDAISSALDAFKAEQDRPTIVIVKSIIAYGAPTKQGHHSAHGEPLGVEEIRGAKRFYGWPEDESFLVPDKVRDHFAEVSGKRGGELRAAWDELFASYGKEYPDLADHLDKMQRRQLPDGWDADLPEYPADPKGAAGRDTSQKVLNLVAQKVPWLIGGSSDLAPSNKSRLTFDGAGDFEPDNRGRSQPALRRP
jgi:transketolase